MYSRSFGWSGGLWVRKGSGGNKVAETTCHAGCVVSVFRCLLAVGSVGTLVDSIGKAKVNSLSPQSQDC